MDADLTEAPAPAGHNGPPAPTPFDTIKIHIESLYEEAGNFADGEPVTTQGQADAVSFLIDQLRKASTVADEHRKVEAKPFDDGKAEVQARYNPLIQKDRGKCDMAIVACKKALAPFLRAQQDEIDRKAREAREAADKAVQAARDAARAAAESSSLAEREAAEALVGQVKDAERHANRASQQRAGGESGGRRVTLRDNWVVGPFVPGVGPDGGEIPGETVLLRYYYEANREMIVRACILQAQKDVAAGRRSIPGLSIENHPVPV